MKKIVYTSVCHYWHGGFTLIKWGSNISGSTQLFMEMRLITICLKIAAITLYPKSLPHYYKNDGHAHSPSAHFSSYSSCSPWICYCNIRSQIQEVLIQESNLFFKEHLSRISKLKMSIVLMAKMNNTKHSTQIKRKRLFWGFWNMGCCTLHSCLPPIYWLVISAIFLAQFHDFTI